MVDGRVRPHVVLRKIHHWLSVLIILQTGLIFGAGLLLMVKKPVDWVQPSTMRGVDPVSVPTLTIEEIFRAAQSVPELNLKSWDDVARFDVQPGKGVVKVIANNNWETQIDTTTGDVLQTAFRRSDIIERIHDGSFFGDSIRYFVFLPTGIVLLLLWASGAYLFVHTNINRLLKRSRRRKRAARARPQPGPGNRVQQITLIILIAVLAVLGAAAAQEADADPFIWLEEIDSERVRVWVDQQNERTVARLSADPRFEQIRSDYLEALQADDTPPPGALRQYRKMIYQLHQNADHPRGVIRQASLDSYLSGAPVWRDLIDVDALAAEEGRNWYARLSFVFSPDGTRALVPLSDGGADAVAYREFDLLSGAFVEDGFITDSRRQNAVWLSNDQVLVSAALRQEEKTRSDQPRVVRFWERGRDLESAPVVFEAPKNHILVAPILLETATARFVTIVDVPSLSEPSTLYAWRGVDAEVLPLDIPVDVLSLSAGLAGLGDEIVFSLTVSWRAGEVEYAAGDIVSVDLASMIAKEGGADGAVSRIYSLEEGESLGLVSGAVSVSADAVYLSILKDVQSRLIVAKKITAGADGVCAILSCRTAGR